MEHHRLGHKVSVIVRAELPGFLEHVSTSMQRGEEMGGRPNKTRNG